MELYIFPFLSAFIACIVFLKILMSVSFVRRRLGTHKGKRHGVNNYMRIGGIAIVCSFVGVLLLHPHLVIDARTQFFVGGLVVIAILGLIDDFYEVSWRMQLVGQACLASMLFLAGVRIGTLTLPFGGIVTLDTGILLIGSAFVSILWIVGIVNALNWSDGIHGLAGGVTFIASVTLFFIALRPEVNQPPFAIIAVTLAGAVLAFTIVNLFGGRVIAGTVGSYAMGYIIAVLAIFAGAKIGTALLVLIVPLMDALYVVWERLWSGESIFRADERHLHHRLLSHGWSLSQILIVYYSLTLLGAGAALLTQSMGKIVVLIMYAGLLLVGFLVFTRLKQAP